MRERLKYDYKQNVVRDENGEVVTHPRYIKSRNAMAMGAMKTDSCQNCRLTEAIKIIMEQNKKLTETNNKLTEKLLEKL